MPAAANLCAKRDPSTRFAQDDNARQTRNDANLNRRLHPRLPLPCHSERALCADPSRVALRVEESAFAVVHLPLKEWHGFKKTSKKRLKKTKTKRQKRQRRKGKDKGRKGENRQEEEPKQRKNRRKEKTEEKKKKRPKDRRTEGPRKEKTDKKKPRLIGGAWENSRWLAVTSAYERRCAFWQKYFRRPGSGAG